MCLAEIIFNAQLREPSVKPKVITIKQTISQSKKYCQEYKASETKKGQVFKPALRNLKFYSTLRLESSSSWFSTAASHLPSLLTFPFSNSTVSPTLRRSKTSPVPSAKSRGPSMCCSPIQFYCLEYLLVTPPSREQSQNRRGRKPIYWFDRARFLLSSRHAFPQSSKLAHGSLQRTKFLPGRDALESDHPG
jgi:hypothetical protein